MSAWADPRTAARQASNWRVLTSGIVKNHYATAPSWSPRWRTWFVVRFTRRPLMRRMASWSTIKTSRTPSAPRIGPKGFHTQPADFFLRSRTAAKQFLRIAIGKAGDFIQPFAGYIKLVAALAQRSDQLRIVCDVCQRPLSHAAGSACEPKNH